MPIYEYECLKCNRKFELLQPIQDRNNTKCPKCKQPVKLLISSGVGKDWFRPHWNEHLDGEKPIYVKSKKHYKKLCKERGVEARCLM